MSASGVYAQDVKIDLPAIGTKKPYQRYVTFPAEVAHDQATTKESEALENPARLHGSDSPRGH